ncbi:MAG: M14 family zinc carboxypeptidase [Acidimicrobiales bacterium]
MKRQIVLAAVALIAASLGQWAPAAGQQPAQPEQAADVARLDVYTATVTDAEAGELVDAGVDIIATEPAGANLRVDAVLDEAEREQLDARLGVDMQLKRDADGLTSSQRSALQAAEGFEVWRSWDEPGGIRDELDELAADNPGLIKREVIGTTYQGREIIALKVTQGARHVRDGRRPAVLYSANQHAREWISVEVNRRLLHWFVDGYNDGDREIRNLLRHTELWFVISANPDGYQFTFDVERLWRKNLRDNNGDGQISGVDGVDPNRNYEEHFSYDEEGSSSAFSSETYRGPFAASEPETVAMQSLIDEIEPRFMSNFHSFGDLILYPQGWQVGTPDADNPIYVAMAGTDANPAIPGFDPGVGSDELYVTNGETTDFADVTEGTIAFTPELGEGVPGSEFVFPDNEALIQAEFDKTLDFSLGLARSARDPEDPESPVGIELEPFYLDQADVDPENGPSSMFDFTFDVSYGDPQEVRVLAKRDLGRVSVKFRINGGRTRSASTREWTGGETYGVGNANYYRVMSGQVRGADPGDTVQVWFESGRHRSESFTYTVASDTGDDVLVMAAEDYTGASPVYADQTAPSYLSFYTDALEANDIDFDVYDVDANGRVAPDTLGVLNHYDAVIWYTGDDIVTREPGWAAGNGSSLAMSEILAVRDFVNEGGRVLYTGKYAGHQYAGGHGTQLYDPFENAQCTSDPAITSRCRSLRGSGDNVSDMLQYWFGAALVNEDAGADPGTGNLFDVDGVNEPFTGSSWGFNGADSAQNQDHSASFISTSGVLPVEIFPQFESWAASRYDRPGGPFDPHSGTQYVYSGIADVSYKRLSRTITVPAGGASLSFWTSYDTEVEWDHLFVEARTPGQDDWTTLPELNGQTTQAPGASCPEGWRELHPHLDHYQTLDPATDTCTATGTTGEWHAASGSSGGWQQWDVDLSAYAGGQVEVSIAYVNDWATQGLGVFVDDIVVSTGEGSTDFEADAAGWEVTGPPEGSGPNFTDFARIAGVGFPEGAVIATDDTLLMGFGFEGITDAATRETVMREAVDYLLR